MRAARCVVLVALLAAGAAPAETTVTLSVTQLDPAGPYAPGDQLAVSGTVAYTGLPRPWGGGGRLTTQTRHSVAVALEAIRTLDDDWPEVPDMRDARGGLHLYDGANFADFSRGHGAENAIWSAPVNPPPRTQRTDPFTHADTVPFEASFTVPDECVAIRLRATLDSTVGANWFVSHYRYDYHPLQLQAPGVRHIRVTCQREPYLPRTRTLAVSDQTDQVTVSGTVLDPRVGPVHRAKVTADDGRGGVTVLTERDGTYSLTVGLAEDAALMTKLAAGTAMTAQKTCDFRLDSAMELMQVKYTVQAPGYTPAEGHFSFRCPADVRVFWLSGVAVHKDARSEELAAQGRVTGFHRIDEGTLTLQGPKGRTTSRVSWGDFVGYAVLRDEGEGEIRRSRIVLLEPDPSQAATSAGGTQAGAQGGDDGFSLRLKAIYDRAQQENPGLVKLWERMGWLIAAKKDWDDALAGKTPTNLDAYRERMKSAGGRVANVLWTLREAMLMLPGLSQAATLEEYAQNTRDAYQQLTGTELFTRPETGNPWASMIEKINADWQVLEGGG